MDREINITNHESEHQLDADSEALECVQDSPEENNTVTDSELLDDDLINQALSNMKAEMAKYGLSVSEDQEQKLIADYKNLIRGMLVEHAVQEEHKFNERVKEKWDRYTRNDDFRKENLKRQLSQINDDIDDFKKQMRNYANNVKKGMLTDEEFNEIKNNFDGYERRMSGCSDSLKDAEESRKYKGHINSPEYSKLIKGIIDERKKMHEFQPESADNAFAKILNSFNINRSNRKPVVRDDETETVAAAAQEEKASPLTNTGTQMRPLCSDNVTSTTDIYDGSTPYFDVTATSHITPEECKATQCYYNPSVIDGLNMDNTTMPKIKFHTHDSNGNRVDHPDYYNLKNGPYIVHYNQKIPIECIDVIRDMPGWKANVIKYLWRCGEKHEQGLSDLEKELEDMEKADWYLDDKIKQLKMALNKPY